MQYIKLIFGWELEQTGPEVQHDTLYWLVRVLGSPRAAGVALTGCCRNNQTSY